MGLGINWAGAAAGYQGYKEEERRTAEDARRSEADAQVIKDNALKNEMASRQRYDWSETDRIRSDHKANVADIAAQGAQQDAAGALAASTAQWPTDPTPAAPAAPPVQPTVPYNGQHADFVKNYSPIAARAGAALGVDPSVLLGQWGLETGWGKSVVPGTNNLGNIKDFTGSGVAAVDNQTGSNDRYRAFPTPEAFADHYSSLIQRKYPAAANTGNDAGAFATALKQGGYAEDPNYVSKVQAAASAMGRAPSAPSNVPSSAISATPPPAAAPSAPILMPTSGIPKPHDFASTLGQRAELLSRLVAKGDITTEEYAKQVGFLRKVKDEGISDALTAFAGGDFDGGMNFYNNVGQYRNSRILSHQEATTVLPDGRTVPTQKVVIGNPDGSRSMVDVAQSQYHLIGMEKQIELKAKAQQGQYYVDHGKAVLQGAQTTEQYRKDMIEIEKEKNRINALKGTGAATAPVLDDHTLSYMRERYKVTDPVTGVVGVDGDGLQFANEVTLARARTNGGDANASIGYALDADNQLKIQAGGDAGKLRELRAQALQMLRAKAGMANGGAAAGPQGATLTPEAADQLTAINAEQQAAIAAARKEKLTKQDADMKRFNEGVGGANTNRNAIMAKKTADVSANFNAYLATIKPGWNRAAQNKTLAWVASNEDVLSPMQLKQIRDARSKAAL